MCFVNRWFRVQDGVAHDTIYELVHDGSKRVNPAETVVERRVASCRLIPGLPLDSVRITKNSVLAFSKSRLIKVKTNQ